MQRRSFIQTGLLTMPLLAAKMPVGKSLKALYVTDMHLSPAIDHSRKAAEFLIDYLTKHPEINILINGGDAVYDVAKLQYPAGEDLWKFWGWFRDQVKIPVFNCLGNHDIYEWELSKEVIENPASTKATALKHLDMPGNYYSFKQGLWKFIVLDSQSYVVKGYKAALDEAQLKWLAEELLKDMDLRLVVISHIPIISACESLYLTPAQHHLYPKIAERLSHTDAPVIFDTLKNRRVELFLHGHLHMQETIQYKNSVVYNGGAFSGDLWRGPFNEFKNCFTLIDFPDSGAFTIKKIDLPDNLF